MFVVDELVFREIVFHLAAQVQRNVRRMAGDVCIASRIGIPLGLTARFHAIEEIAHMESGGITTDFFHGSSGQQFRRAQHHLAAVACFDPAFFAFEAHRARAERNPAFFAEDQLRAVLITCDQLAILRCVVFDRRWAIADRPLAQIDTVRAPFEHATADQSASFFEIETIEQLGD